jgi:hypothetical protein
MHRKKPDHSMGGERSLHRIIKALLGCGWIRMASLSEQLDPEGSSPRSLAVVRVLRVKLRRNDP